MLEDIRHYLVNWSPGMKLSKVHFEQLENAFLDLLRDSRASTLTDDNYGLIASNEGIHPNLNLLGDRVFLKSCRAITRGGNRIEVLSTLNVGLEVLLPVQQTGATAQKIYDVELVVDIFSKGVTNGERIANESPRRFPFKLPKYSLEVNPVNEHNDANYYRDKIVIERLQWDGANWSRLTQYIPPCAQICASDRLSTHWSSILLKLNNLRTYSIAILQKIDEQEVKDNITPLVQGQIKQVFIWLNQWIVQANSDMEWQSPKVLHQMFHQLASVLLAYFLTMDPSDREGLKEYFKSILSIDYSPNQKVELYKQILNQQYNHLHIYVCLEKWIDFLSELDTLFEKLHKQKQIFFQGKFNQWESETAGKKREDQNQVKNKFENY